MPRQWHEYCTIRSSHLELGYCVSGNYHVELGYCSSVNLHLGLGLDCCTSASLLHLELDYCASGLCCSAGANINHFGAGYCMDTTKSDIGALLTIINRVHVAMMTTSEPDGSLHSRPLATLHTPDFEGVLWFFTAADSSKVTEIGADHHVNLSYSDPSRHYYASVSGMGTITRDKEKMAEFWSPMVKAWFPKGLDDPNLVLLKVSVEKAEYWDASGNPLQRLAAFTKALVQGDPSDLGENKKIDVAQEMQSGSLR